MNQTIQRTLFFLLTAVLLLSACAPAPAPTQDPAVIEEQIQQAVQATIAAENAQATEQQALIVPSNTPLPTQTEAAPPTETPSLPTATPFVIVPPTSTIAVVSGGGGGGSNPPVQANYSCNVVNRKPADNTVYKPGKDFDISWTIVNTGKKTLRAGTDVKYFSGEDMATVRFVELPELKPGEQYKVVLDADAPSKPGRYVMTWTVEGQLCFPYVAITVEK